MCQDRSNNSMQEEKSLNFNPIKKYWEQRYNFFHEFDKGIILDEESWYSVTPEDIACHQAQRCKCDCILDAFVGAGGNAIQFAKFCGDVIAVDIDPNKLLIAKHNASIFDLSHKIEFQEGNFLQYIPTRQIDAVFLSPPWGGPGYLEKEIFDIDKIEPKLFDIMTKAFEISPNVAIYLPKNTNIVHNLQNYMN